MDCISDLRTNTNFLSWLTSTWVKKCGKFGICTPNQQGESCCPKLFFSSPFMLTVNYVDPGVTVRPFVAPPRLKAAALTKEERKELNDRRKEAASALHFDMEEWFSDTLERAEQIAQEHGKTTQQILSMFFSAGPRAAQHDTRKINIWNAFLWKKAQDNTTGLYFFVLFLHLY